MTQGSENRLDRIERILEATAQQQQLNTAATVTNNLTIAQILEQQQRSAQIIDRLGERMDARFEGLAEQQQRTDAMFGSLAEQKQQTDAILRNLAEQQQLTQLKINETVGMQQHTLQIIDRVDQQQERSIQMIDRLGERIDNLSTELSSSMADLIRIIDYAMEQIGETIRNYLKPSNNGNGSNPPTS